MPHRAITLNAEVISQGDLQELEEAVCAAAKAAIADDKPIGVAWTLTTSRQYATVDKGPATKAISTDCKLRCKGTYSDAFLVRMHKVIGQIADTSVTLRDGAIADIEADMPHLAGNRGGIVAYESALRISAVREVPL